MLSVISRISEPGSIPVDARIPGATVEQNPGSTS